MPNLLLSRVALLLVAACALLLTVGASGTASAASVAIYPLFTGFGVQLYVQNSLDVPIGQVEVLVTNATGFAFNTELTGLSLPDSIYRVRPIDGVPWDALIASNLALGVTLVPAGATVLLGTFSAGSTNPVVLPGESVDPISGNVVFGPSFITASGDWVVGRIEPAAACSSPQECLPNGFRITVPEVELSVAVALALALQLLGGKIRRRSGSVGAPT